MRKGTCCVMRGTARETKREETHRKQAREDTKSGAAMIY